MIIHRLLPKHLRWSYRRRSFDREIIAVEERLWLRCRTHRRADFDWRCCACRRISGGPRNCRQQRRLFLMCQLTPRLRKHLWIQAQPQAMFRLSANCPKALIGCAGMKRRSSLAGITGAADYAGNWPLWCPANTSPGGASCFNFNTPQELVNAMDAVILMLYSVMNKRCHLLYCKPGGHSYSHRK